MNPELHIPNAHFFIDHLWYYLEGVYVRGWAHCLAEPVNRLRHARNAVGPVSISAPSAS